MITKENARLCKAIGLTSKLLGIYINENLQVEGVNLTFIQFIVLKAVNKQQGISQKELACITERDKTSLARLITTMETKGMIERRIACDDRRKKKLYITDLGVKSLTEAWPRIKILENEISKNISTAEFENMINVLNKVQANVQGLEKQ